MGRCPASNFLQRFDQPFDVRKRKDGVGALAIEIGEGAVVKALRIDEAALGAERLQRFLIGNALIDEHAFELGEILSGQLLVAPEPDQGDVIVVLLQEVRHFHQGTGFVERCSDVGFLTGSDLIGIAGVAL